MPLIEKIEEVITENDTTFSSFVIQACEFVLENMEQKVQRIEFVKIIMLFVI